MNVLIIEDETLTANRLELMLKKYDPVIRVLAMLPSVKESLKWFQNPSRQHVDLIFMDLHLEDDLAFKIIDQLNLRVPIIFTTAYSEYALKAFKANGIDYLLKPIDPTELYAAIDKFRETKWQDSPDYASLLVKLQADSASAYRERFMASAGTKLFSIASSEIAYFSIEQRATFLKTFDEKHLALDYSLDKLILMLDPNFFFRINRSLIVSLRCIHVIHVVSAGRLKLQLKPDTDLDVFVSGDRIADFKQWLGK